MGNRLPCEKMPTLLYYETANNFYNCLNELKNDLITQLH